MVLPMTIDELGIEKCDGKRSTGHMMKKLLRCLALIPMLLTLCSCMTGRVESSIPRNDPRVKAFLAQSKDPRRYWLHVYDSNNGPIYVGGHRLHPNQIATLPFASLKLRTAPLVRLQTTSEDEHLALLDTTTKESWISFEAALKIGLIPMGPPPHELVPIHVKDTSLGVLGLLSKLRFDTLHMENALFHARLTDKGLGPLVRDRFRWKPQIVVGYDMLGAFRFVQFDFANREVMLSSTLPYEPNEQNLVATVRLQEIGGVVTAKGTIDDYQGPIIIDVAGDYHIASTKPNAEYAQHVGLGELVFRHVPAVNVDDAGLGYPAYPRIGRKLLSRFKVTLDNKRKLIYFERPEKRLFL